MFTLVDQNGALYPSLHPGALGGHSGRRLYGRLDCRSALRAIARGGYVSHRVFFADEATAVAAGYRPCAVCMPLEYHTWKAAQVSEVFNKAPQPPAFPVHDLASGSELARDNPQLSRLRGVLVGVPDASAVAPAQQARKHYAPAARLSIEETAPSVSEFLESGKSAATRRAYESDLAHFRAWGGSVPATDVELATYLAEHATTLKVATLARRVAAISVAHEAAGLTNPARSQLIKATLRGIRRKVGMAQRQAKPLLREDLITVLASLGTSLRAVRDKAILLIGFAGGFRSSELVALECFDLERVREGLVITLRTSKTDQEGTGRRIGIPFGRTSWCPVGALDRWLDAAMIDCGPVFRPIDRFEHVSAKKLSTEAVGLIVRERVRMAGFDPSLFSGHSLRAGFATSAARIGIPSWRIRQQTGHSSDSMLQRYIRDGELFRGNPTGDLL